MKLFGRHVGFICPIGARGLACFYAQAWYKSSIYMINNKIFTNRHLTHKIDGAKNNNKKKNDSHVSAEVYHEDMSCHACTPTPVGWRGWMLVLDGKLNECIIFVFSYTIGTKFDKKKIKLRGQKIKVSAEVYHEDKCHACTPTPVGWHGWMLVLNEKLNECIISVFSYTISTKFDKK